MGQIAAVALAHARSLLGGRQRGREAFVRARIQVMASCVSEYEYLGAVTTYHRAAGISWPVRFAVADGRRFTVLAPQPGSGGPMLWARVEGPAGMTKHEIGPYKNEMTARAVIGRTVRWWIETTGETIAAAKSRQV
jgi:hypothetical protein